MMDSTEQRRACLARSVAEREAKESAPIKEAAMSVRVRDSRAPDRQVCSAAPKPKDSSSAGPQDRPLMILARAESAQGTQQPSMATIYDGLGGNPSARMLYLLVPILLLDHTGSSRQGVYMIESRPSEARKSPAPVATYEITASRFARPCRTRTSTSPGAELQRQKRSALLRSTIDQSDIKDPNSDRYYTYANHDKRKR